jgi:hypothetical protein
LRSKPSNRLLTVDLGTLGGVASWILRPNRPQVCEPPWYTNWDRNKMIASASAVVRLQPQVLAPGHGHPLSEEAAAAELRAYALRHGLSIAEDRAPNVDGLSPQA